MKLKPLDQVDPQATGSFKDKEEAVDQTETNLKQLSDLLYLMFAESKYSLLIILQGIDASGKDGTIKHIFSGANPQGVRVHSFKEPSEEDLRHDFLWRCHRVAPESGMAAIFNRSYYEEVTTVKVHPEYLKAQHLPKAILNNKNIFKDRYAAINSFEKMLSENGTVVMKFFLHISKDEQERRFKDRLENPQRNWKFSKKDTLERRYWNQHMKSFGQMIQATHTTQAPWHIIPADKKWYRNYLITQIIVEKLESLPMAFPRKEQS